MITAVLIAAAALVVLSPLPRAGVTMFPRASAPPPPPPPPGPPAAVGFQSAIADLATVRRRLAETDHLTDAERAAIDALTLALVAGSDQ
jgi:hypothetical protein